MKEGEISGDRNEEKLKTSLKIEALLSQRDLRTGCSMETGARVSTFMLEQEI